MQCARWDRVKEGEKGWIGPNDAKCVACTHARRVRDISRLRKGWCRQRRTRDEKQQKGKALLRMARRPVSSVAAFGAKNQAEWHR